MALSFGIPDKEGIDLPSPPAAAALQIENDPGKEVVRRLASPQAGHLLAENLLGLVVDPPFGQHHTHGKRPTRRANIFRADSLAFSRLRGGPAEMVAVIPKILSAQMLP